MSYDSIYKMKLNTVVRFTGDLAYHIKEPAVLILPDHPENYAHGRVEPFVLINLPLSCHNLVTFLRGKLDEFEITDDVYHPNFSETGRFLFQYRGDLTSSLDDIESAVLEIFHDRHIIYHCPTAAEYLPEGPYFLVGNSLHQAWRLYPDVLRAFVVASIPTFNLGERNQYDYEPLMATSPHGDELAVAAPSRLYTPPTDNLPLNGKRISIKDNIHLAGIKTSMGNQAYVDYYGPQPETAEYIKLLIDKGAIILGKTKINAFAGSEKPPNQAIDYFPPWNPRSDGYQRPAGSSAGAGVSVAGYNWCDFAIGTDTTGSGREPARATGVQGLRLSHRIVSSGGLVPSSEEFDSWSLFTRSLDDMYHLADITTGRKLKANLPKKILYPTDWFPYEIPEQQKMNERILAAMESVLDIKHTKICLADMWRKSPPKEAGNKTIAEFLENSGFWPMYYDNYHTFDEFRGGYEKRFGKPVYVSPSQQWKWDLGSRVTLEERAQGLSECQVYKKWIEQFVLTMDSERNSDAVILLPLGNAKPEYRDVESGPPRVVKSFEPKYFGSILGLPQIVTPIGQLAYVSRITKRSEHIPVIATIAGAQGSDLSLVTVMQKALDRAGLPTTVQTGRNSFL
ncbi:amidase signature enzyme [Hypoxylon sp. NC1633]|nr:amidase signature enzyme [Hypoxylon sp. NC1633]